MKNRGSTPILTKTSTKKSNTECGIIRPTKVFTWDHIHYLEVAFNIMNVTIYVCGCLGCYIFNITGQTSVSK